MAIREIVESDISGSRHASTITFSIGDSWYEIDLTDEELAQMRSALAPYIEAGRPREVIQPTVPRRTVARTTPSERERVRSWARTKGYEFAARGRIPQKIQRAYDEAHGIKREMRPERRPE